MVNLRTNLPGVCNDRIASLTYARRRQADDNNRPNRSNNRRRPSRPTFARRLHACSHQGLLLVTPLVFGRRARSIVDSFALEMAGSKPRLQRTGLNMRARFSVLGPCLCRSLARAADAFLVTGARKFRPLCLRLGWKARAVIRLNLWHHAPGPCARAPFSIEPQTELWADRSIDPFHNGARVACRPPGGGGVQHSASPPVANERARQLID